MWPPSGGNHVKTWKQHLCGLHNLPGETVAWSFFAVCTSSPVCDGFASGVSKAGQFSRLFLVVFFHLFTILLGLLCRLWSFWGRHGFLLFHFWISFINFSKYLNISSVPPLTVSFGKAELELDFAMGCSSPSLFWEPVKRKPVVSSNLFTTAWMASSSGLR